MNSDQLEPSVGIFWGISGEGQGTILLADKTPIGQGEAYGECITHATGHYEFWESLSEEGASSLIQRGMPAAPAWHEYEDFPRGRVVYWPEQKRFVIYADKRLQTRSFIELVVAHFCIPTGTYVVKSDSHYRTKLI